MVKLYSEDNCKDLPNRRFVKNYKEFPIYKYNNLYLCDTDIFVASGENIEDVEDKINKLLCDRKLLLPLGLYNESAGKLEKEISKTINSIITKWMNKGYNLIDIKTVITTEIDLICAEKRMRRMYEIKKGKYKRGI